MVAGGLVVGPLTAHAPCRSTAQAADSRHRKRIDGTVCDRAPAEVERGRSSSGARRRRVSGLWWRNDSVFLRHVPERVWHYQFGGYPLIKKWLGYRGTKRRPGRPLTHEELDHLGNIIHRIAALLRLNPLLDHCYEQAIQEGPVHG